MMILSMDIVSTNCFANLMFEVEYVYTDCY